MDYYGDFATYTKTEPDDTPVVRWAVWDDGGGLLTSTIGTKVEAEAALPRVLDTWRVLNVDPENTRVRQFHVHDDGVAVVHVPADECHICPPADDGGGSAVPS